MKQFYRPIKNVFLVLAVIVISFSCETNKKSKSNQSDLIHFIETFQDHKGYDRDKYPLGLFTEEYYKNEAEFAQKLLDSLSGISAEGLTETNQISLELLRFRLQETINQFQFEAYLNPLLSDSGFHSNLNYQVGSFSNYKDVKDYLEKLKAIPVFVDQHFELLRKGMGKGIVQPRVIFKGYESTYEMHITEEYESNFFYSPFKSLPNDLTEQQKDSVLIVAQKLVDSVVVPQFKRIKEFFETEYLPNAPEIIGVSNQPNGLDYYQNRINYYTTSTQYTADDIHKIGLEEVSRIKSEMEQIISDLGFEGSFDDFFHFLRTDPQFYATSPRELLMIARDMAKRVDAQLPRYFLTLPRKPYGVAPVPDAIAPKYTGGRYVGTSKDSKEPGYYWVNTYDLPSRTLYTLPSLTVHEAVPGHHLQGALNNELGDSIPKFRRNMYLSAYGEGWGLYCEYLAEEMGMYTTPYEKFGQLTYEMWRACRLVVDTGIHAKGWTRDQVVEFMSKNTALSLHEINTETDRYISWPGQAISYKIGELKIRELRKKAEEYLGSDFDIRKFHEVILEQGTVTLPILEKRVLAYIQKANNKE